MATGKIENLDPVKKGSPEAKARGKQGGIKSGIAKREKKLMSQIYAEFLDKDHEIIGKGGEKRNISGNVLVSSVMSKVLSRGDSSAVSLMREIREGTEGSTVNIKTNKGPIRKFLDGLTDEDLNGIEKI